MNPMIKPLEFTEAEDYIEAKNHLGTFRSDYQKWDKRWKSVVKDLVRSYQIELWQNDIEDAMEVAESLQIRSLPTIAYYVNGELKLKESGVKSKDYILNKLKELKGGK